jgi:hypothetical protein
MLINFTRNTQISRLVALALLAVCLVQLPTQAARAAEGGSVASYTQTFTLLVGIAPGQTLRLSLANLIKLEGREEDPVEVSARAVLYDERGVVIAQTEATTVPLDWIRPFDFDREAILLPGEGETGRLQVRGMLEARYTNVSKREAKTIDEKLAEFLPASFQIIDDTTGAATAIVSFDRANETRSSAGGGIATPALIAILAGAVASRQLARFTLSVSESEARNGQARAFLVVYDGTGDIIFRSPELAVPAGQFRSFDFNPSLLSLPGEPGTGRLQVRAVLEVRFDGTHQFPFRLDMSAEVIDNGTGKTAILISQKPKEIVVVGSK